MHIFPSIPEGPYEGYIFDCDGTLANSMGMHYQCWHYVLKKHGARFEFTWEMFRENGGMGLEETVHEMNRLFDESMDPKHVIADILDYVHKNHHRVSAKDDVISHARELKQKAPISVASGGPRIIVHRTLQNIGAHDIFEHVVTQDDVERCKPHPDLFLLAAEKMGVNPKKCLVYEDSPTGIEAAKRAGMHYVLVPESELEPAI